MQSRDSLTRPMHGSAKSNSCGAKLRARPPLFCRRHCPSLPPLQQCLRYDDRLGPSVPSPCSLLFRSCRVPVREGFSLALLPCPNSSHVSFNRARPKRHWTKLLSVRKGSLLKLGNGWRKSGFDASRREPPSSAFRHLLTLPPRCPRVGVALVLLLHPPQLHSSPCRNLDLRWLTLHRFGTSPM